MCGTSPQAIPSTASSLFPLVSRGTFQRFIKRTLKKKKSPGDKPLATLNYIQGHLKTSLHHVTASINNPRKPVQQVGAFQTQPLEDVWQQFEGVHRAWGRWLTSLSVCSGGLWPR